MNYGEATFAKKLKDTMVCGELNTKIARWVKKGGLFIYYLCDFHAGLLKLAYQEHSIEEYAVNAKKYL